MLVPRALVPVKHLEQHMLPARALVTERLELCFHNCNLIPVALVYNKRICIDCSGQVAIKLRSNNMYFLRPPKKMLWDFPDKLVEKRNVPRTLSISHMIPLKEGMSHGLLPN